MEYDYNQFLDSFLSKEFKKNVGTSNMHNIDKTACFYHVITTSRFKQRIFYYDVAQYRFNLLSKLCRERNVKIIFSTTMSNHTHEAFLTPSWETLSEIMRILNTNVSKFISRCYGSQSKNKMKVFSKDIAYIPIRSISQFFYLGKYILSNPEYLADEGKSAPFSCFWMLEKDYYPEPFDSSIYTKLFSMKGSELVSLYNSMSKKQAYEYAQTHFDHWTDEMTTSMFYRNR